MSIEQRIAEAQKNFWALLPKLWEADRKRLSGPYNYYQDKWLESKISDLNYAEKLESLVDQMREITDETW